MLSGGVAACHKYVMCTVRCVEYDSRPTPHSEENTQLLLNEIYIYNNYCDFWFWIFHLVGEVSLTCRRTADDPDSLSATDVGCNLVIYIIWQGASLSLQLTDVTIIW